MNRGWCAWGWVVLGILYVAGCTPESRPEQDESTSETATVEDTADVHPVVDVENEQLFGALVGDGRAPAEDVVPRIAAGETYRLYSLDGFLGTGTGSDAGPAGETCTNPTVRISPVPEDEEDVVAVGGDWDAMPRLPSVQDSNLAAYREAASALLRASGISDPDVRITQILRVDLEGDGTDEALMSGALRRGQGTSAVAGDYAFIVLRKIIDGEVATLPLEEQYFPEGCIAECAPAEYRVSAVLDVDGDGVMEVVVAIEYYEGSERVIYGVDGDRIRDLLSWRCGA